jgi:hypothetical protein
MPSSFFLGSSEINILEAPWSTQLASPDPSVSTVDSELALVPELLCHLQSSWEYVLCAGGRAGGSRWEEANKVGGHPYWEVCHLSLEGQTLVYAVGHKLVKQ